MGVGECHFYHKIHLMVLSCLFTISYYSKQHASQLGLSNLPNISPMKMHFGKSVAVCGPERAGGGAAVDTAHMAKGTTTSKSGVPLTNMVEASRMAAENAGEADADANEKVKTNAVKESALPTSGQIAKDKEATTNAVKKSAVDTAHMAKGATTSKNGVAKTHHTEPRGKQLPTNMAAAPGKAAVDDREAY